MRKHSNSIALCYFSGTGNTAYLAQLVYNRFRDLETPVRLIDIEEAIPNPITEISRADYDVLGLAYPVHALNAPAIVFDFIESLPPGSGKRTFIIKSPADPFFHGGSSHLVIRALENRGYRVFHESMIVMPANVFIRYPDEFIKQLIGTAERRSGEMAEEVIAGVSRLGNPGFFARLCTRLFSSLEVRGGRYFGRGLRVSDECVLCERCIRKCPRGNIFRREDRIVFGGRCMICMRCLYGCPSDAITPRLFAVFKLKRWYDLARIATDKQIRGRYVYKGKGGIYRLFSRYLVGGRGDRGDSF